jgi:lipopolysaccharide transport system ATP-binding protein
MSDTLINVDNVSKRFCRSLKRSLWYGVQDLGAELVGRRHGRDGDLRPSEFWAVQDVSFELKRGECLGLIGRNGAGKTTLLRMLNGLIKPDSGRIEIRGQVGALIALGAGFNPILTGRENIYVNASVLGLSRTEVDRKLDDIIEFAELWDFIDAPVQSYSSGMQVRLGFSIASTLKPDILLLDEVLAVGDAAFRSKCFQRIGEVLNDAAVIFVSHSEAQVSRICDSTLLLDAGKVRFQGSTVEALRRYREAQPFIAGKSQFVTDTAAVATCVAEMPTNVIWGGTLDIRVTLELRAEVAVGLVLVHLSQDNEYKTNAELRLGGADVIRMEAGCHVVRCAVSPLHLAQGRYDVSVSIFDESGKKTVAQMLNTASVEMTGPLSGGVPHLVPLSVELEAGDVKVKASQGNA